MPDYIIWSAPEEPYENHITLCLKAWKSLKGRMLSTLCRLFELQNDIVDKSMEFLIICHDIGKLSMQWQEYIHKPSSERKFRPPHATLGASYLLISNGDSDLNKAAALAILMHHTDSGLAQGNLEHPAEDAINRGLIDYKTDIIRWAKDTDNIHWVRNAEDVFRESFLSVFGSEIFEPLSSVTLQSLEDMALQLRQWARCPKEIERHQHRLKALAIHHILKVCDWRAAAKRPQSDRDEEDDVLDTTNKRDWQNSILNVYLEGGLLS
jgi:CRISPR-associated endonuclease Cas3-HD